MSQPIRTCIGCRGRSGRDELWRLVLIDGTLNVDLSRTAPGRGANIHPERSCWELAIRRRAIGRALRVDAPGVGSGILAEDLVWAAAERAGLDRRVGLGPASPTA